MLVVMLEACGKGDTQVLVLVLALMLETSSCSVLVFVSHHLGVTTHRMGVAM